MTNLVNPDHIEEIVGVPRDEGAHIGIARTSDMTFYIMHSKQCVRMFEDLRECPFSKALDKGFTYPHDVIENKPTHLGISHFGTLYQGNVLSPSKWKTGEG